MEENTKKEYPYLAYKELDGKRYVVFFTGEDEGVVVMSEIANNPNVAFGKNGSFDESGFTLLDEDICVRLQN